MNRSKTLGRVLTTVGAVLVVIAAVWGYIGDYVGQLSVGLAILIDEIVLLFVGVRLLRGRRAAELDS